MSHKFERKRPAMVTYAAIMMFVLGGFALIAAIAALVRPAGFEGFWIQANMVGLVAYGLFDLIVAIGAFYAGYRILKGGLIGFGLGLIFAGFGTARWFLLIVAAPALALVVSFLWFLVIVALLMNVDYFR
jgi:hypothetical protein